MSVASVSSKGCNRFQYLNLLTLVQSVESGPGGAALAAVHQSIQHGPRAIFKTVPGSNVFSEVKVKSNCRSLNNTLLRHAVNPKNIVRRTRGTNVIEISIDLKHRATAIFERSKIGKKDCVLGRMLY